MKWYFLFRIQHAGHNAVLQNTHRFTTWSDVFNIPSELRLLQVTVKPYCPYIIIICFFSAIKTRNSTIRFSPLVPPPHPCTLEVMLFPYTHRNLNYYDACKCVGVVFLYFVQERVPRVIPFRLSKTNQADHMCLGAPSFWSAVYA